MDVTQYRNDDDDSQARPSISYSHGSLKMINGSVQAVIVGHRQQCPWFYLLLLLLVNYDDRLVW